MSTQAKSTTTTINKTKSLQNTNAARIRCDT